MPAFTHHLFICGNQRSAGHRRGCCDPAGTEELRNAIKNGSESSKSRPVGPGEQSRLPGTMRTRTGRRHLSADGFYGNVTVADAPRIIEETAIHGRIIEELRIAESCLNNPDCEHTNKS